MILPGSTIGILGGGQLGRMLAASARQHGYRVVVFASEPNSPAAELADAAVVADYGDVEAVARFASGADVVTFEFENVPAASARAAAEVALVRPDPQILYVAQDRHREKSEVAAAGFSTTPYRFVPSVAELAAAWEAIGSPAVLKTAQAGYDGKGQRRVETLEAAEAAFEGLGAVPCVLEAFVRFDRELSVVVARGESGEIRDYGVFENEHASHILDVSVAPASLQPAIEDRARALARSVAERLGLVGVACVELFCTDDGQLWFNELAPRPHNSGHLTIEAHETHQFEQQLRAVCGLPLGSVRARSPAAMVNLLGDLWGYHEDGTEKRAPAWERALALPGVHLHLYGKTVPRPGRKMGHLTVLAETGQQARALALAARAALAPKV